MLKWLLTLSAILKLRNAKTVPDLNVECARAELWEGDQTKSKICSFAKYITPTNPWLHVVLDSDEL